MAALAQRSSRSCVGLLERSNADDKRGHISLWQCPREPTSRVSQSTVQPWLACHGKNGPIQILSRGPNMAAIFGPGLNMAAKFGPRGPDVAAIFGPRTEFCCQILVPLCNIWSYYVLGTKSGSKILFQDQMWLQHSVLGPNMVAIFCPRTAFDSNACLGVNVHGSNILSL